MGNTAHYAIPYPELNMAPDGPSQMRSLADKVDISLWNDLNTLKAADTAMGNRVGAVEVRTTKLESSVDVIKSQILDTGPISLTVTYATGWALGSGCAVRAFGPVVNVSLSAKRTGSAITAGSTGNITDTLVLTIPNAAHQPHWTFYGICHPVSGGSPWEANLSSAGNLYLIAANRAGAVIATNDEVRGNYTFMI